MKEFKQNIANEIIKRIIALRISKAWTQSELARKAGVTRAAISQIEKGDRLPSMKTLKKIGNAFNIFLIEDLCGDIIPAGENEQKNLFSKFGDLNNLSENERQIIMFLVKALLNKKESL